MKTLVVVDHNNNKLEKSTLNTIKAAKELGFEYFCSVDDYEIPGIKFLETNINYSRNSIIADLFSTNNVFCYHLGVEHHQKVFKDIDTINKAHEFKILERYLGKNFKIKISFTLCT